MISFLQNNICTLWQFLILGPVITITHPCDIVLSFNCQSDFLDKNCDFVLIFARNIGSIHVRPRLIETILTSNHNLCLGVEISKINYAPVDHSFLYVHWDLEGYFISRTSLAGGVG